jgi:LacI family transcriptional regulator
MLLGLRVEGLIVLANWVFMDVDVLADLGRNSIPTVMIGHELKKGPVSSVIVDNEAGARLALEHIHSLGHREIAFIRGPKGLTDSVPRWRGVRKFADANDLELDPKLIVELPESQHPMSGFEAGFELTRKLIETGQKFTALMAFDDMSGFGAVRALAQRGIRVPDDCSVIGFDDIAPAALYNPPITTVRQPMQVMGSMAVEIALQSIRNSESEAAAVHRRLAPELVVRESTKPLNQNSGRKPGENGKMNRHSIAEAGKL